MPFWWQRFMQDTTFQANLYCRWQQVRQTVLSNTRIFAIIDSAYNVVQEAQQRHFTQWPILGQYVWPNPQPIPTSYDGEISTLKTWLTQRLSWLDDNMPKTGICVNWPATNKGTIILKIPNPVINFYLGNIQSKQSQTLYVRVIDMLGRVVYANTMQAQAGANAFPGAAGLNSLQTGIYFIQIISETGEKVVMKVLR
jgi:hypothetical protein